MMDDGFVPVAHWDTIPPHPFCIPCKVANRAPRGIYTKYMRIYPQRNIKRLARRPSPDVYD